MAVSPQRLTIYLYSTHRAVIFAIAQLSCVLYYHRSDLHTSRSTAENFMFKMCKKNQQMSHNDCIIFTLIHIFTKIESYAHVQHYTLLQVKSITSKATQDHWTMQNLHFIRTLAPYSLLLKSSLNQARITGRWMDGWLGFNGILSTQVAAISCLRKFKVC